MILASALAHMGQLDEARQVLQELLSRVPEFSARYILDYSPIAENDGFRHMVEGLQKAGLAS